MCQVGRLTLLAHLFISYVHVLYIVFIKYIDSSVNCVVWHNVVGALILKALVLIDWCTWAPKLSNKSVSFPKVIHDDLVLTLAILMCCVIGLVRFSWFVLVVFYFLNCSFSLFMVK